MTEDLPQSGTLKENVSEELGTLKSDITKLAQDIRASINSAGREAKETWGKLDAEGRRFVEKVEQAAEETAADLRHVGSDLQKRLENLWHELKSEGGEKEEESSS